MEEAEEAELYMNEQYSSRQEELEKKTKKLKRLWIRYREKSDDLKDIQDEYDIERTDIIDTIRDLSHQLKVGLLKAILMEMAMAMEMAMRMGMGMGMEMEMGVGMGMGKGKSIITLACNMVQLKTALLNMHVSGEHLDLIEKNSHWDAFSDEWRIAAIEYAGNNLKRSNMIAESDDNSSVHTRRALTFKKIASGMAGKAGRVGMGMGMEMEMAMPGQRLKDDGAMEAAMANMQQRSHQNVYFSYGIETKRKTKARTKAKAKTKRSQKRAMARQ